VQQLDAIAFPKLDDEQMAKLGRYVGVSPKNCALARRCFAVAIAVPAFS
jgi:hypothetical protein